MGQSNIVREVMEDGEIVRRFVDAGELTEKMLKRMKHMGSPFCPSCREDLIKGKRLLLERQGI